MKSSTVSPVSLPSDRPNLLVFPPALPLGGLALGFVLQRLCPLPLWPGWLFGVLRVPVATILVIGGFGLVISSNAAMRRAGTNVSPRLPALRLVARWPFSWSRNPMYLGGNLALLGLGLGLRLPWIGALFPFLAAICHYGIVLREEAYLEQKFGDDYRAYRGRVKRWW